MVFCPSSLVIHCLSSSGQRAASAGLLCGSMTQDRLAGECATVGYQCGRLQDSPKTRSPPPMLCLASEALHPFRPHSRCQNRLCLFIAIRFAPAIGPDTRSPSGSAIWSGLPTGLGRPPSHWQCCFRSARTFPKLKLAARLRVAGCIYMPCAHSCVRPLHSE